MSTVKVSTTNRVELPIESASLGDVLGGLEALRDAGVPATAHVYLETGWGAGGSHIAASWVEPTKDGPAGFAFTESIRTQLEFIASNRVVPAGEARAASRRAT